MDKFYINFINKVGLENFRPTFQYLFNKNKKELIGLADDYVNSNKSQEQIEKELEELFSCEHPNTVHLVLQILASKPLYELYLKKGIDESVFYDSMYDLKAKYQESIYFNGVEGTHCVSWQRPFFRLGLIGIGLFEYDVNSVLDSDKGYSGHGINLNLGDKVMHLHVPSGTNFTKEQRLISLKKAYEFFKDKLIDGKLVLCCESWLFYPDYEEIFKKDNIHDFRHEFEIIEKHEQPRFQDTERIFGNVKNLKVEDYPENTSIQRAFKDWLIKGKNCGYGVGYLVFDGNKILTEN